MKTSIRTHDGRVALVTGAGQGIGQAIALALAGRGARVIATDLEPPHETARKIGPEVFALQLDVTREEDWRSVAGKAQDVDIVVNNAGYFPNRTIDDLDLPTWRKTMARNLDSHFLSVKYFLPAMRKKKWGRFVGISSNMVGLAIPGMSHYITTKMGIIGFMRGLANDVASDGITANSVLPGLALPRTQYCPVSRTHLQSLHNRTSKNATLGASRPSSGWENLGMSPAQFSF